MIAHLGDVEWGEQVKTWLEGLLLSMNLMTVHWVKMWAANTSCNVLMDSQFLALCEHTCWGLPYMPEVWDHQDHHTTIKQMIAFCHNHHPLMLAEDGSQL